MGKEGLFEVDFYGKIDAEVKDRFMDSVESLPNVCYNGFLDLNNAEGFKILESYDAMLFPTMHPTEGFPGVIADAAIAALPVIASDWPYADEIIGQGDCGILFPVGDNAALTEIMNNVIEDRSILEPMRVSALKRSSHYDVNKLLNGKLIEDLGMSGKIY